MSVSDVRLALVGAGLIGRRHAEAIAKTDGAVLCAIADPAEAAAGVAARAGASHHTSLGALLAGPAAPDGIIVATPNALHAGDATRAIEAGLPTLVEKPITEDVASAQTLVALAEARGVPLLCGHHRRHGTLMKAARQTVEAGRLGRLVAIHATAWLMKPDGYFEAAWRLRKGAGPVLVNLIHDIDLMRAFAGDVASVCAMARPSTRGGEVEESAVAVLDFAGGALGTLSVSDTIAAPWSWELTSGENPAYPQTGESAYLIGGTNGSLALPAGGLWTYGEGERSWWQPISRQSAPRPAEVDPLVAQMENFVAVIRGEAAPLVSGLDGLKALAVVEAILRSAATGKREAPAV